MAPTNLIMTSFDVALQMICKEFANYLQGYSSTDEKFRAAMNFEPFLSAIAKNQ